jgi:hypothetical protein
LRVWRFVRTEGLFHVDFRGQQAELSFVSTTTAAAAAATNSACTVDTTNHVTQHFLGTLCY